VVGAVSLPSLQLPGLYERFTEFSMRLSRAIDLWTGELARAGRTPSTRASYERYLLKFVSFMERSRPDVDVREVTTNDCRGFLDAWNGRSASTVCSIHSTLSGLFRWLYVEGEIDANPMARIPRPRRPRAEDVDVVIVTSADVERMLAATADWQEFLCLSVLAYLGPRRDSVSRLRWRDVDLAEGTIRFREKGNKISVKPMPDELRAILRAALESTQVRCGPDDYVIPNRRSASVRRAERSNKLIWETVLRVGERVGVRATTHALRRAFAVAFLTSHPGAIESLQALMNHARIDTTQVYLRALNGSKAMEVVRDLSWRSGAPRKHRGPESRRKQRSPG
jgi:integrase